jgi:hypothetical protein
MVTQAAVAALAGLDRLLVARAVRDTGNEGGTASISYIGGNHMALMYVTNTPALDSPTAGYVFQYKTREVNRFREAEEHAWAIEARASWDVVLTATDAGYLIKSAA